MSQMALVSARPMAILKSGFPGRSKSESKPPSRIFDATSQLHIRKKKWIQKVMAIMA